MKNLIKYTSLILILLTSSCEDIINVDLETGRPQIIVDGWLNNKFETQRIRLISTIGYFDTETPPAVENATVRVIDQVNNKTLNFTYDKDGYYTWTPTTLEDTLIVRQRPGDFDRDGDGLYDNYYKLEVSVNFDNKDLAFESYTSLERVPPIDSIFFQTSKGKTVEEDEIYGELFAKDFVGPADCYWIKTWKNGNLLNKSSEILLAFDITPGRSDFGNILTEPTAFIPPVRLGINLSISEDEENRGEKNYEVGDSVYCEIHSMTEKAFDFMSRSRSAMSNGGLFATPLANVPTNIIATNQDAEGMVIGVFNGSAISSKGYRINTKPPYDNRQL
ncbi:DUF4249 domain-containing protein [Flammeovirga sp. MY04]|uniref:DUF4249 family protein n=1 Tax=Flammeovirga sp. MY04 TaxID=1191459 RepID=UPI000806096F|nr:DUF4249 family protein [Flammeovirga sp. MY04]ANQ48330.1 DUF4249 domain-containing protein [Flammeovirga sp. MY04]